MQIFEFFEPQILVCEYLQSSILNINIFQKKFDVFGIGHTNMQLVFISNFLKKWFYFIIEINNKGAI